MLDFVWSCDHPSLTYELIEKTRTGNEWCFRNMDNQHPKLSQFMTQFPVSIGKSSFRIKESLMWTKKISWYEQLLAKQYACHCTLDVTLWLKDHLGNVWSCKYCSVHVNISVRLYKECYHCWPWQYLVNHPSHCAIVPLDSILMWDWHELGLLVLFICLDVNKKTKAKSLCSINWKLLLPQQTAGWNFDCTMCFKWLHQNRDVLRGKTNDQLNASEPHLSVFVTSTEMTLGWEFWETLGYAAWRRWFSWQCFF